MKKYKVRNLIILMLVLSIVFLSLSTGVLAEKSKKGFSINTLTYSGGTIGGTSNLMANGLSAIGYKFLAIQGTVVSNPTMTQVMVLQENEADISTIVGYQGYFAYNGAPEYKGKPFPELRILFQGNRTAWHMAVLEGSPIYDIRDLKGKRVVVGKKGFFSENATKYLFSALGFSYNEITPVYLGHGDAMAALLSHKVDAYVVISDPPQPTLTQLAQAHKVRIIGLTEEEMKKALIGFPGCIRFIIPGGTYKGNEKDILCPVSWMFYGCRSDLPEDVVYGLVKAFWENQDFAGLQWSKLADYKIEDIPDFKSAPYHIGAYKYYKEKGLVIPEDMIPPEAK